MCQLLIHLGKWDNYCSQVHVGGIQKKRQTYRMCSVQPKKMRHWVVILLLPKHVTLIYELYILLHSSVGVSHFWIYVSTKSLIKNSKSSWTCSFFNKIIALQCSIYHSNEKPNKRVIFSQSGSHLNFISVWNYFYMPKSTSWQSLSVALLLLKHWNYLILHQHSFKTLPLPGEYQRCRRELDHLWRWI